MREKLMVLVNEICNTESIGCRALNKKEACLNLMQVAEIDTIDIKITEIPVCWDSQVVVLYTTKNNEYREYFCGIGNDGNFYNVDSIDSCTDET